MSFIFEEYKEDLFDIDFSITLIEDMNSSDYSIRCFSERVC